MKFRKMCTKDKLLTLVGIILTISGLAMFFSWPVLFNNIINSEFMLRPNSKTFDIWESTPMPVTLDFYIFNWTNPEDFTNHSIKPRLVQMGPYKFRESSHKVDITWNDDNNTVTFKQLKRWYFDEKRSNGTLSDNITTLNVIPVTAAYSARYFNYIMKRGLSLTLTALVKDTHVTKTVQELLFNGYSDPVLDMVQNMPSFNGVNIPPFDKFGWFYKRNGTTDFNGLLNMATGKGDKPLGTLVRWNLKNTTDYYEGQCANINGSAGEFFPQHNTKESISMFSSDMCRRIELGYEKPVEKLGIEGYKYVGGAKMMDNGSLYPENECFCNGECVPSGTLNLSSCRYGSPGFVSFPHFYAADPYYINQVEGLHPDKEKHEFFISLQPRIGIPLEVAARFQINILVQPIENIAYSQDWPRIFFPMLWMEQHVVITDDLADGLKTLLNLPLIGDATSITIIVLGVCLVIGAASFYIYKHYNHMKKKTALQVDLKKEEVPLNDNSLPQHKIQSNY